MADRSVAYRLYVGVEVAAETFVAAWLAPEGQLTAPITGQQTAASFAARAHRRHATGVPPAATLIVLEATSGWPATSSPWTRCSADGCTC